MSGLSWTLRRRLYQQASSQLDNGMTLSQVLGEFSTRLARRGRKRAAEAADEVARRVVDGDPFVLALGDDLSDLERSVLDAGDQAGQLPDSMRLVMEVRDLTTRLRQKLQASFFAPSVYLVSLYAVLLLIGASIVPQFLDVLPLSKWTDWAYAMYLMGDLAVGWPAPICFGGLLIYAVWSWWALPRWIGPARAFCDRRLFPLHGLSGNHWLHLVTVVRRALARRHPGHGGAGQPDCVRFAVACLASETYPQWAD
ncbi:type II secretion system F family protein [Ralstonia sp. GP101]|uniref:type II secretion system F family protein n=1 Tax=Ralstonia sp. GP101 TaxID=3035146 RepID=UPI003891E8B0